MAFGKSSLDVALDKWNSEGILPPQVIPPVAVFPPAIKDVTPLDSRVAGQYLLNEDPWETIWSAEQPTRGHLVEERQLVQRMSDFIPRFPVNSYINFRVQIVDPRVFWLSVPVDAVAVPVCQLLGEESLLERVVNYYGGPSLTQEVATYGNGVIRCIAGGCIISHGHNLKQKWVLHYNDFFDGDTNAFRMSYTETIWKVLSCVDGNRIRTLSIPLFDVERFEIHHVLALLVVITTVRNWMEAPENRMKCDKIYFCAPTSIHNVLLNFWHLAFPH